MLEVHKTEQFNMSKSQICLQTEIKVEHKDKGVLRIQYLHWQLTIVPDCGCMVYPLCFSPGLVYHIYIILQSSISCII